MNILRMAGRAALTSIFVTDGLDTLRNPRPKARIVEQAGLPHPELLTQINGAVMLVAGAFLGLGQLRRFSALMLLGALVPTTVVGHPFWQSQGKERSQQRVQFLKNLAAMGGLLLVLSRSGGDD